MKVLVRDRRAGKTTELIQWLLQGREQDTYPYWTRVIVVPTHRMVPITTRMVWEWIQRENWNPCDQMLPHMHCNKDCHDPVLTDVRKAVWCLGDLERNLQGSRNFEYGLDDAEQVMHSRYWPIGRPPAVIVMTGECVDSLCD